MTLGVVLLVHQDLERVEQVARFWSQSGAPVVIHVDKAVSEEVYNGFVKSLSEMKNVQFSKRYRCQWGTWSIVAATQCASECILREFPQVKHVFLASGACLPLRPVQELIDYLGARPRTDFIESATTSDVQWAMGGLNAERFLFRFPFSWRKNRRLFDLYVRIQRFLGVRRSIPDGVTPHLGSQWWCLTRQTLSAILQDKSRAKYERFFRTVWIPDESYFQTLARQFSREIESRSLTLSKFDFQGQPHIFYDDHLPLLRRSDCFVARKIWPDAHELYDFFLSDRCAVSSRQEPTPGKIDRVFAQAIDRRRRGREGLFMQSRYPKPESDNDVTAANYSVFHGFTDLFEDFQPWLAKAIGLQVHGHLFAPDKVHFANAQAEMAGALSDNAFLRDYDPNRFLSNLLWNTRSKRQCFQFSPADNQEINWRIARDPNAHICVVTGAWAVRLFHSNASFSDLREQAAHLQKIESAHLEILRSSAAKAKIRIWDLAEFVEKPMQHLQAILSDIEPRNENTPSEVPLLADLAGFGQFLQNLKNQGMHPYLVGEFLDNQQALNRPSERSRPYVVR
ncbi:MAG: beta-1,6-N-acetylglucosaminyltransferase [Roseobacter sp.]